MRLAITGGQSRLAAALAAHFNAADQVRLAVHEDAARSETAPGALAGDLRDPAYAAQMVQGADTLFHLAPLWTGLAEGTPDEETLDLAARGTYVLLLAAVAAGVKRVVLASTLDLFEAYPSAWWVSEAWQTRPTTRVTDLAPFLAEACAREISRVEPLQVICLRLGKVVGDADTTGRPYDSRWLHVDDAVQAFERALVFDLSSPQFATTGPAQHGWWAFHIPGGGAETRIPLAHARLPAFGYAPRHSFAGASPAMPEAAPLPPPGPVPSRPIRNVVVFGAGGPLASATTPLLAPAYRLRVTDLRPLAEFAADPRVARPGRPLPPLLEAPHEMREVDVTDPAQVLAACEGMDAIVNCSVVRPHPVNAFSVNTTGAYNIARAVVAHRIRRVVQTGPQQVTMDRPGGYWWDFDVPDDAPARPGSLLYSMTKFLGQEVLRVFAEQHQLEVPVLLFSRFVDPAVNRPNIDGMFPMTVSWEDAGYAIKAALEAPSLPSPFEVFHILADLPHGKFSNEKAKRVLTWQPRDTLEHLWGRRHTIEEEASR